MTHRIPFWTALLTIALLVSFTLGGCAKKQVREEGAAQATAVEQQAPVSSPSAGVTQSPARTGRQPKPPPSTAAVSPAPQQPVSGGGLSQATTKGLERIHFDFDKALVTSGAREILTKNGEYLLQRPAVQIRIEGHCDERGTTEYNLALGERRAKSAHQYLMDLGVDPNRMTTVSYGEEVPLDAGHNEMAWAKNRRAEFVEIQR